MTKNEAYKFGFALAVKIAAVHSAFLETSKLLAQQAAARASRLAGRTAATPETNPEMFQLMKQRALASLRALMERPTGARS